jgi:hypothetical protein
MASIINASSTGSGGIVQTADASGALQLQSNGTVGITVNTSGYVAFRDATVGTTALTLRAIANTYAGGALGLQDAAGTSKTYITSISNATFFGDNTSVDCATINQYGFGVGGTLGTSGKGITFPASQSASTNANTLDDYEEGLFTATVITSTSGTITLNSGVEELAYTKIGRVVYVQGLLEISSVSSPVGAVVYIQGLPFTTADLADYAGRGGTAFSVKGIVSGVNIYEGQTQVEVNINASTLASGNQFYVSFNYIAA